jgi:hypothetical protein
MGLFITGPSPNQQAAEVEEGQEMQNGDGDEDEELGDDERNEGQMQVDSEANIGASSSFLSSSLSKAASAYSAASRAASIGPLQHVCLQVYASSEMLRNIRFFIMANTRKNLTTVIIRAMWRFRMTWWCISPRCAAHRCDT